VRLETEGYEPVEFDVRVPDNDRITIFTKEMLIDAPPVMLAHRLCYSVQTVMH
jgi:hypothetical protein